MLGCVSSKKSEKAKYIYHAQWISIENRTKKKWFTFGLVADDNTFEQDFNNLSGKEGVMNIVTKSMIKFDIDDIILFQGQKYNVTMVDGNRKEFGEQAFARVRNNGNIPIYLTLRKAG